MMKATIVIRTGKALVFGDKEFLLSLGGSPWIIITCAVWDGKRMHMPYFIWSK